MCIVHFLGRNAGVLFENGAFFVLVVKKHVCIYTQEGDNGLYLHYNHHRQWIEQKPGSLLFSMRVVLDGIMQFLYLEIKLLSNFVCECLKRLADERTYWAICWWAWTSLLK